MKKESIISTIFLLLVLVVAIVTGLTVISDAFQRYYDGKSPVLFTIGVLIIGFIFNIVLMELAHVVGAKVGKCKVVSVNFYFICFFKTAKGWKVGTRDFDGLTGETKITTTKESKLNYYIWMPIVFYAIELAICILLYTSGQSAKSGSALRWLGIVGLLWIILSSMLFVYDFIPARLDTMSDGYRMMLSTKKVNYDALLKYMNSVGEASLNNNSVSPEYFDEITDFTADLNLFAIESAILAKKYDDAKLMIEKMNGAEKLAIYVKQELVAQDLFIRFMCGDIEETKKFYEEKVDSESRKFLANSNNIAAARAYMFVASQIDKSSFELSYAISKKEKVIKRLPKSERAVETAFYDEIVAIVEPKKEN